ncbi:MAG: YitT family protein [Clostridia bacterium]
MQRKEKFNLKKISIEITGTILGAFIMAVGVSLFLLPNQLSSGGIAGIATITYYLFHIPMGTMMLLINVPLFLFSIFKIGKSFFIKSMIGTIALSVFIDFLDKLEPLTNDRFLACIYGGIIIGLRYSCSFKSKFFYRRN